MFPLFHLAGVAQLGTRFARQLVIVDVVDVSAVAVVVVVVQTRI